jgi:hypothetical protein
MIAKLLIALLSPLALACLLVLAGDEANWCGFGAITLWNGKPVCIIMGSTPVRVRTVIYAEH